MNQSANLNGILLVDKPSGVTSHDVVDMVRRAAGIRRIGHTGTLDPSATGLLVLCLGQATRLSEHLTGLDKVYEGTMRFGVITDSYDLQGRVVEERPVPELTIEQIQNACDEFTGNIMQLPPMVSAVKVGGERLYKRARQGEVVEREPRPVTVMEFAVSTYDAPDAAIRIRCSRGTYVRSLCHDVGEALGCGAVLAALRRTFVGEHCVKDACPAEAFKTADDVVERLLPMDRALGIPVVLVSRSLRSAIASGAALRVQDIIGDCPVTDGWVQIKFESGRLVALGLVKSGPTGLWIHPKRVLMK